MRYWDCAGDSVVAFELAEQGGGTSLTLTHHVVESFSGDIPESNHENCETRWKWFINDSLSKFINGGK